MFKVKMIQNELEYAFKLLPTEAEADDYIAEVTANNHWGNETTFQKEDITTQHNLDMRIKSLVDVGLIDNEPCKKCLALIGGYNLEKNLTASEIQAIASTFSSLNFALSNNMPRTAKSLISLITDDSYTTELKALLLEVLKAY